MATNPFPPQAYTRDTLIRAFQWLSSQSPQIKALASTPDLLISLYQKAQIQGKDALERPQLQNFKNELRSLAGQLGEFDTSQPDASGGAVGGTSHLPPAIQNMNPQPPAGASSSYNPGPAIAQAPPPPPQPTPAAAAAAAGSQDPQANHPHPSSVTSSHAQQQPTILAALESAKQAAAARSIAKIASGLTGLDSKTLEWLEEIQRELNLDSPSEALRLAVSVGYGRLAELFPKRR